MSLEMPSIPSLDDLADTDEIAAYLRMTKRSVLNLRFREPPLPYIRFGNVIYFSKTQVAWWLNEYQVWSNRRFAVQREIQRQASQKRKGQ